MCEREDSDEEHAAGLTEDLTSENVHTAPSHPNVTAQSHRNVTSFPEENQQHAGSYAYPIVAPSGVASLPCVVPAAWCPSPVPGSAVDRFRFLDAGTGINMRFPNPIPNYVPLMVWSGLALQPETRPASSEEKKDSSEETSELCAVRNGASPDMLELFDPSTIEDTKGGAKPLTAGIPVQCSDDPNNCDITGSEDASDIGEDDDEDNDDEEDEVEEEYGEASLANIVSLEENCLEDAGISSELTRSSASAVNLDSMQGDIDDIGPLRSSSPEPAAVDFERDLGGVRRRLTLNSNPLHGASSTSQSCAQLNAGFLNIIGSNLPDPSESAGAVGGVNPPDTGQSTVDDDDHRWATCKICWLNFWELIFYPCGHGCCQPCYKHIPVIKHLFKRCPFCRRRVRYPIPARVAPFSTPDTHRGLGSCTHRRFSVWQYTFLLVFFIFIILFIMFSINQIS